MYSMLQPLTGWVFLLFVLLFSSTTTLTSQDASDRGTLWQQYRTNQADTAKIQILADLAYAYRNNNVDSAILLAEEAMFLATQIGFSKGRAKALTAEGAALLQKAEYAKAIERLSDAIKIFDSLGEEVELAKSINELGLVYYRQGNLHQATREFDAARKLAESNADFAQAAKCWNNLGIVQNRLGNFTEAIEAYLQSNQSLEENGLPLEPATLTSLGNIYNQLGNYDISLSYYRKALPLLAKEGNQIGQLITLYNVGTVYEGEEKLDSAMLIYQEALTMGQKMGARQISATIVEAMGNVKTLEEEYIAAERFFTEAVRIQRSIGGDQSGQVITLLSLADLALKQDQINKAEKYALNALKMAKSYDLQQDKQEAYGIQARVKEKQGKYRDAFEYQKREQAAKDSLLTADGQEKLNQQRARYEFQLKQQEHEIALMEAKSQLDEVEKSNQRSQLIILGSSLFLITALGLLLLRFYLQKEKANKDLAIKNEKLNESNRNFEQAVSSLQSSNQQLETARHKLQQFVFAASHDLRESLRSITSFSQLLRRKIKKEQLDAYQFLNYIMDGGQRMKKILDDLLSYSNLGLKADKVELIQTEEVIETVLQLLGEKAEADDVTLEIAKDLPLLEAHRAMLEQLFFNVLENSFKYRHENQHLKISIDTTVKEDQLYFLIKDNGIGIEANYLTHIFDPFYRVHDRLLSGSGLGLAICRRIVQLYNGDILAESEPDQGTAIYFSLPGAAVGQLQENSID